MDLRQKQTRPKHNLPVSNAYKRINTPPSIPNFLPPSPPLSAFLLFLQKEAEDGVAGPEERGGRVLPQAAAGQRQRLGVKEQLCREHQPLLVFWDPSKNMLFFVFCFFLVGGKLILGTAKKQKPSQKGEANSGEAAAPAAPGPAVRCSRRPSRCPAKAFEVSQAGARFWEGKTRRERQGVAKTTVLRGKQQGELRFDFGFWAGLRGGSGASF